VVLSLLVCTAHLGKCASLCNLIMGTLFDRKFIYIITSCIDFAICLLLLLSVCCCCYLFVAVADFVVVTVVDVNAVVVVVVVGVVVFVVVGIVVFVVVGIVVVVVATDVVVVVGDGRGIFEVIWFPFQETNHWYAFFSYL